MTNTIILIVIGLFCFIVAGLTVFSIIKNLKKQKYKKVLDNLEYEKNTLASSPVEPELAKVETYLKNEKLEVMYNDWTDRLQNIKEIKIPKITDMLIEADYSLSQKDYKSTMYKIAKLEMEIYKVRTTTEFLLDEIKDITNSEERNRALITKLKVKYRELFNKFTKERIEYLNYSKVVTLQFENIAKRFQDFEIIMEKNEYTEAPKIVKIIEDMLNHMEVIVEELPAILLLAQTVLPKKIKESDKIYMEMTKQGFPLGYLNVEFNTNEATKKIKDVLDRAKELNIEESLFELKVLSDYFDNLFNDFEKEKVIREKYNETKETLKTKLYQTNKLVDDIFRQLSEIKTNYDLKKEDLIVLKEVKESLRELNRDYKILNTQGASHSIPFSKLTDEVENLISRLSIVDDKLDSTLGVIGNMKDDEVRARQQLSEIKIILKDAKTKMRQYKLPVIPNTYYVELRETSEAIKEIIKELNKKPIQIKTLNIRVDTARDLVLKIYGKTKQLTKTSMFAETAIVYGNRFRSAYEEIDKQLNISERMFNNGEYKKSLEVTINALNTIEPGIYDKLTQLYEEKAN